MKKRLSIIIPAANEGQTIGRLLRQLRVWSRQPELIVVANGCRDNTVKLALQSGATVIDIAEHVGQDVGRSIGLAAASGDILLVLDADMLFSINELEPFVAAVEDGADLALNQYPLVNTRGYSHSTAVAKQAVNLFLARPDLGAASLTAVPHALSRRALGTLGTAVFAVPPRAQVEASLCGLDLRAVAHVPVGQRNPLRKRDRNRSVERLIIGDCLEAVAALCSRTGVRAQFADLQRRRDLIEQFRNGRDDAPGMETVAIIPAQNEQSSLPLVLSGLNRSRLRSTCVVCNGSSDATAYIARRSGALVREFPDALGHDVGRAIGCVAQPSARYLFLDADIPIQGEDAQAFVDALDTVDVALNNLDVCLQPGQRPDAVLIVKRFLNIALARPDLGVASMTAIPHALRAEVVDAIGPESLAVPPLAQVKAALAGFRLAAVHTVDVLHANRFRRQQHSRAFGKPLEKLIIGDHLEALHYLQGALGDRGYFPDTVRRREWLDDWRLRATVRHGRCSDRALVAKRLTGRDGPWINVRSRPT